LDGLLSTVWKAEVIISRVTDPTSTTLLSCSNCSTFYDGSPRIADGIADRLANYLHAAGRDHPQHPDRYGANLLIDQVGFTAHSMRAHRREPLQYPRPSGWEIS